MEYIREKHYSVALIRIKELEKKLHKLLAGIQGIHDNLDRVENDKYLLMHQAKAFCKKLIAEVEEDRHVKERLKPKDK